VALAALAGCAGARFDFAADRARYPVSFSPALPDESGTILYLGHELESKGTFRFETTQIGFVYGATGGKIDVSDQINEEVAKRGGEGVVDLVVRNDNCWTNYLWPFQLLPFYPGCQNVTVTGTVVGTKAREATPAPSLASAETKGVAR
jgi:hypothetical protein